MTLGMALEGRVKCYHTDYGDIGISEKFEMVILVLINAGSESEVFKYELHPSAN
jgi:hypothetical protein